MRKAVTLAFFVFMISYCLGQERVDSTSQTPINRQMAHRIEMIFDYFSFIGNKSNSLQTRLLYIDKCMSLFIGNGGPYVMNGIEQKGALIEVASLRRKTSRKMLLKNYLQGLANLRYDGVKIEHIDVAELDLNSLQKKSDSTYVCRAYISSQYECKTQSIFSISNRREILVSLNKEEVEGDNIEEYVLLFGNIYAVERLDL